MFVVLSSRPDEVVLPAGVYVYINSQKLLHSFTIQTRIPVILIMEIIFSSFSFSFSFLKHEGSQHVLRAFVFVFLFGILKFKVVNTYGIAVLDAQRLEPLKKATLAKLAVEVHPRFVILEIDVVEELDDPRPRDLP